MTSKMMHQTCYSFLKYYEMVKKLIFWLILRAFLFISSYTLWNTPQDVANSKILSRYISVVRFIRIAYVVVKSKVFKDFCIDSAFSIYEMAPFCDFLVPYSHKYCLILLEIWPEVVSIKKNTLFERILQNLEFWLK